MTRDKISEKSPEIVRGLRTIAEENNLSIKEVMKTYERFNYIIYNQNNEFQYNSKLEEKSLKATKNHYNLQNIIKEIDLSMKN